MYALECDTKCTFISTCTAGFLYIIGGKYINWKTTKPTSRTENNINLFILYHFKLCNIVELPASTKYLNIYIYILCIYNVFEKLKLHWGVCRGSGGQLFVQQVYSWDCRWKCHLKKYIFGDLTLFSLSHKRSFKFLNVRKIVRNICQMTSRTSLFKCRKNVTVELWKGEIKVPFPSLFDRTVATTELFGS